MAKRKNAPNRKVRGGKKKGATNATLPPGEGRVKRPHVEIIHRGQLSTRLANTLRFLGSPCICCGHDARLAVLVYDFDPRAVGWQSSGKGLCLACGICLRCLGLKKAVHLAINADAALTAKIMERLALFAPRGEERPQ